MADKKSRWMFSFQFKLRTLLVMLTGVAILLFFWIGPSVEQRRDVEVARGFGFSVKYSESSWLVPGWFQNLLGEDFFCRVVGLDGKPTDGKVVLDNVSKLEFTDRSPTSRVNKVFPNVNLAILKRTEGDFEFLKELSSLKAIWNLSGLDGYPELSGLTMIDVSSAIETVDCQEFTKFPNLKTLIIRGEFIHEEAMGELSELETLTLGGYGREGKHIDLQIFSQLTKLEQLLIRNESVSSLGSLANLRQLKLLEINCTGEHNPADLYPMTNLRKLKIHVELWEFSVLDELQVQLPDLQIEISYPNTMDSTLLPSLNSQKAVAEK